VQGSGCWLWGLGFRVQGAGFRVPPVRASGDCLATASAADSLSAIACRSSQIHSSTQMFVLKVSRLSCEGQPTALRLPPWRIHCPRSPAVRGRERELFIDNLLVRIRFIIAMVRWTGLAMGDQFLNLID